MNFEPISVVSMPWHLLGSPSIQLGTIHALADREGIPCRSHSLHLQFAAELLALDVTPRHRFGLEDYTAIGDLWANVGAGEWAFAAPPMQPRSKSVEQDYGDVLRRNHVPKELRRKLARLREFVPGFLERCADEILDGSPAAVGFTVTYAQRMPSLALAHVIKQRAPDVRIVLGGAGCESRMGLALLRAFDFVDVVVRGKIEAIAGKLLRSLSSRSSLENLPGLCWREDGEIIEVPEGSDDFPLDKLPTPVFDEFFERLESSPIRGAIEPELPIETSRGCWWGEKSHCTFCGLNGGSMAYRSKSPERVIEELSTQASKYEVLDFTVVDNILDMDYLRTLMPTLGASHVDFNLFYEVKSNLTFAQLQTLRAAGVRRLQPGLESLSTPVLRLMRKGTTAMQNIKVLKWCRQLGIHVDWNLLYGFPGEDPDEYGRMAEIIPSLTHLDAPRLVRVGVDRFSPYHDDPEKHGLRLEGPPPYMSLLYDLQPDLLSDLNSSFLHSYIDGRTPDCYVDTLRDRIATWLHAMRTKEDSLTFRRGPDFLIIVDKRRCLTPARYTLDAMHAAVYLACDSGATVRSVAATVSAATGRKTDEATIHAALQDFLQARLVYEEGGRFLSLAVPPMEYPAASEPGLVDRAGSRDARTESRSTELRSTPS